MTFYPIMCHTGQLHTFTRDYDDSPTQMAENLGMADPGQDGDHSIEERLWSGLADLKATVRGLGVGLGDPHAEAVNALAAEPIGSMVCGMRPVAEGDWEMALLVRERSSLIDSREIEIQAGLFLEYDALPGAVMLAGNRQYVAWLDWHGEGQQNTIRRLAAQEWVPVLWYDEQLKPTRQVRALNQCAAAVTTMIETWEQYEPWSVAAFDWAVDRVLTKYPDLRALWSELNREACSVGSGPIELSVRPC